ncbi:MAG: LexA family transcriptional regulator [Bacteroidia bacterium]|nr:LexA family transcriptional regulator [Bacteroidia bacterium]MDG2041685.1 LexA family transcriptional regulator [Bacteroidia bacterium]
MHFDKNIKLLRTKKGISQQDLADSLDLTRSKLNSYERGVQPPFDIQIEIADYFNVTLDGLVRHDLSKLTHFKLTQILKGSEADLRGRKLRLLTVSVDANEDENIEVVSMKAQAGYTNGYADPEFIEGLPKFKLPFLPKNKTYRSFQIKGDSMPPISEGSWVTASYLQDWNDIKDGENYIVVTKDDGVVFKRLYNKIKEDQSLTLVSTNSAYAPYPMHINQVIEIWKFETWNGFEF